MLEAILTLLKREKKSTSDGLSAGFLSSSLNLPLHSIYDGMVELRKLGYKIEAEKGKGYKLVSLPERLYPLRDKL